MKTAERGSMPERPIVIPNALPPADYHVRPNGRGAWCLTRGIETLSCLRNRRAAVNLGQAFALRMGGQLTIHAASGGIENFTDYGTTPVD